MSKKHIRQGHEMTGFNGRHDRFKRVSRIFNSISSYGSDGRKAMGPGLHIRLGDKLM